MRPVARRSGLLLRELADELLVYDQEHHRAHCLNRTAAQVFHHADGTRTLADLAMIIAPEGDRLAAESVVTEALARLDEAGLIESEPVSVAAGLSRREVVRRVGLGAAILLPAVASIVAPTPAEAAATCVTSCAAKPAGTPCTCFGADPCTSTCDGFGVCQPDGVC